MLINRIGVEDEDDIVDLESRRATPDPKNRETMTTLLRAAMAPIPRSELLGTPVRPDATVSRLSTDGPPGVEAVDTDVA